MRVESGPNDVPQPAVRARACRAAAACRRLGLLACALLPGLALRGAALGMPVGDSGVVRFDYPDTTARQVFLAGDFNGWSQTATPLDREGGVWRTRVFLDPGDYEYKFLADGAWKIDPGNLEVSARGSSVLHVGADGEVLPARATPQPSGAGLETSAGDARLDWGLRYIGLLRSRRERALDRYDLERPLHDVDLRLDVRFTSDASGWVLAKLNNLQRDSERRDPEQQDSQRQGSEDGRTSLRWDRGQVEWRPDPYVLRLFDSVDGDAFDDPGALLGRIGIYSHAFGFERRGVSAQRLLLGAPIQFVYADDSEPDTAVVAPSALPELHTSGAAGLAGTDVQRYTTSAGRRGSDVLALRARGGTDRLGLGVSFRLDRGGQPGHLADVQVRAAGDTLLASGREFETVETWRAWGIDARYGWRGARLAAEYLSGSARARAVNQSEVLELRAAPGSSRTTRVLAEPVASHTEFDLDHSRRVVVNLAPAPRTEPQALGWSTRDWDATWTPAPPYASSGPPRLVYEYEEHDFAALVTGAPFLMRRNTLAFGMAGRRFGFDACFDVEHHWFVYPAAARWQTQFWFRQHDFWLDEDTARFERLTLLGEERAGIAHLSLGYDLWPARAWRAEGRITWAAPGLDRSPRYVENVLRLVVPLRDRLELRTHSRLVTYRQFEALDAADVSHLGPARHFETGAEEVQGQVQHAHRTLGSHFVELIYRAGAHADVSLGFGVDPIALYEVTNEYADIGWDAFLFAHGASPATAFAHPAGLGRRIENAERALQRERRVQLESRVRF